VEHRIGAHFDPKATEADMSNILIDYFRLKGQKLVAILLEFHQSF